MYDIFYISKEKDNNFCELQKRFPLLKIARYENKKNEAFFNAQKKSLSKFFWLIDEEFQVNEQFDFQYEIPKWDEQYVHVFQDNNKIYGGIYLIPKNYNITNKEAEYNFFINKKDIDISVGVYPPYDRFIIEKPEDYFEAQEKCKTSMFFAVPKDFKIIDNFEYEVPIWDKKYVHMFKETEQSAGVVNLIPREYSITKKEAEYNFFINKKVIDKNISQLSYDRFIIKKPEDYFEAQEKCKTSMFYAIDKDWAFTDNFKFDIFIEEWDKKYVHTFSGKVNSVFLIPKDYPITKKEAEHNFFVNKKEINITISKLNYDRFIIEKPEDYFEAQEKCKTSMFYAIDKDYEPIFNFEYIVHDYDKKYVHIFKKTDGSIGGIYLIPKDYPITKKEAEYSFFVNKKEVDIIACEVNYDRFIIEKPEDYFEAQEKCKTSMFYAIDKDYRYVDNIDFITSDYDKKYVHVFKRNDNTYGNIFLIPKDYPITKKEAEYSFFVNKKEVDIIACEVNYDRFIIEKPEDYFEAQEKCKTSMFYVLNRDFKPLINLEYIVPDYEKNYVNVFKTIENEYGELFLIPKDYPITKKEAEYSFFVNKKEVDIIATKLKFDIVFISFNEPNADENYELLVKRFPNAKRVHGVKGIHQAHIAAAKQVETSMFWVVDGDAIIEKTFDFYLEVAKWNRDAVHVFRSQNPINGLIYGYGGVKLLPTNSVLNMNVDTIDMTTSISKKFISIDKVSNITSFNTDPFNTWKSAFRECVKLSSKIINEQKDKETEKRLEVWCNVGKEKPFGKYAISGALSGKEFGLSNANNKDILSKINDWNWLENKFKKENK